MRSQVLASMLAFAVLGSHVADASTVTVQILNADPATHVANVFSPGLVRVAKGDTVKWLSSSTMHNVAFVEGGVPAGVPLFVSPYQGVITYTFTKPGLYLYKCMPHFGLGMVGLVVVGGDTSNLAAIKALDLSPLAKHRIEPFLSQIQAGH